MSSLDKKKKAVAEMESSNGRRYWRSLDQLADKPEFQEFVERDEVLDVEAAQGRALLVRRQLGPDLLRAGGRLQPATGGDRGPRGRAGDGPLGQQPHVRGVGPVGPPGLGGRGADGAADH